MGYVQRFRGRLVFKAHRLCVSLNSRLQNNKEEEGEGGHLEKTESRSTSPNTSRHTSAAPRPSCSQLPYKLVTTPLRPQNGQISVVRGSGPP